MNINNFIPVPCTDKSLKDIVETMFPLSGTEDIGKLVRYLESRTDAELAGLKAPEKVVYEDYFEDVASEFKFELTIDPCSGTLDAMGVSPRGIEEFLYARTMGELEMGDWNLLSVGDISWEAVYDFYTPTNAPAEEAKQPHIHSYQASREDGKSLHRRHRRGHMKDVARHGHKGKCPIKWLSGKANSHLSKERALIKSQKRLEEEAWR